MTYPYPIPGAGTTPVQIIENYFYVGNECCSGSIWKDVDARVRIFLDYSQAMANVPGGNTIVGVTLAVSPIGGTNPLIIVSPSMTGNLKAFLIDGGMVGSQYNIEAIATLTDGQIWVDNITVGVIKCGAQIPGGGVGGSALLPISETVAVTGVNSFAQLSQIPVSNPITLVVNGQSFFNVGSPPDFSVSGKAITWLSTLYSVSPGDRVVAVYYFTGGTY